MKKSLFDEIPVLSPEQAEKERQIEPEVYQDYRNYILKSLANLSFSEKYKIIKKVDKNLLARFNTFLGTKAVHTLDYMHKMPSRKKNLNPRDSLMLLLRSLGVGLEIYDYYKERRKMLIKLVK